MGARKIKDVAVKVGEYEDRSTGQKKNRYLNVGALMKNDDGSVFMLLERTFNPAGIADSGRGTVLLSCFDLREQGGSSGGSSGGGGQSSGSSGGYDDEIPF